MPKMDKHEGMLNEMHSALHSLGDKIRKPFGRDGDKLLPRRLRPSEAPEAKAARKHIEHLHRAMRGEK
jgi:hypothetical protein